MSTLLLTLRHKSMPLFCCTTHTSRTYIPMISLSLSSQKQLKFVRAYLTSEDLYLRVDHHVSLMYNTASHIQIPAQIVALSICHSHEVQQHATKQPRNLTQLPQFNGAFTRFFVLVSRGSQGLNFGKTESIFRAFQKVFSKSVFNQLLLAFAEM